MSLLSVCVQLPTCLCIHIQRTSWLNSGVAVKRFDHVSFTELLDMAPYVYCKRAADKLRPKTLDVDATTRLVGGRTHVHSSRLSSSTTYALLVVCVSNTRSVSLCSIFSSLADTIYTAIVSVDNYNSLLTFSSVKTEFLITDSKTI